MRIDTGDSRLDNMSRDIFRVMADSKLAYLSNSDASVLPHAVLGQAHMSFIAKHPEVYWDPKLLGRYFNVAAGVRRTPRGEARWGWRVGWGPGAHVSIESSTDVDFSHFPL
jgi:hypothetical protein